MVSGGGGEGQGGEFQEGGEKRDSQTDIQTNLT